MFLVNAPQFSLKQPFWSGSGDLYIGNGAARGRNGYGTGHAMARAGILHPSHHQVLATALGRAATELSDPCPLLLVPRLLGVKAYAQAAVGNSPSGRWPLPTLPRRTDGPTVPLASKEYARRPLYAPSPGRAKPSATLGWYSSAALLPIAPAAGFPS